MIAGGRDPKKAFFISNKNIMKNQIKITIEGKLNGGKNDVARVILWALNKREEYQERVIVFNIDNKIHPSTETADVIIETKDI